jgi:hypothetical protein
MLTVTTLGTACAQHDATVPATTTESPAVSDPVETQTPSDNRFDAVAGRWTGNANIIVTWVQQKQVTVTLMIDGEGNVSGRVGDATLVGARLNTRTR